MDKLKLHEIEKANRDKLIAIQMLSVKIVHIIQNKYNGSFDMFLKDNHDFDIFLKNNKLDGVNTHFNLTHDDFKSIINNLNISYQNHPPINERFRVALENVNNNVDENDQNNLNNQKSRQYTKTNGRGIRIYE